MISHKYKFIFIHIPKAAGTTALESAGKDIVKIKNVILGTHGREHDNCCKILKDYKFDIRLNLKAHQVPIQPDGLIWATK